MVSNPVLTTASEDAIIRSLCNILTEHLKIDVYVIIILSFYRFWSNHIFLYQIQCISYSKTLDDKGEKGFIFISISKWKAWLNRSLHVKKYEMTWKKCTAKYCIVPVSDWSIWSSKTSTTASAWSSSPLKPLSFGRTWTSKSSKNSGDLGV